MRPVQRQRGLVVAAVALASLVACRGGPATEPASEEMPAEAPSVCDEHAQRGDVPTRPPPPEVEAMLAEIDPQRLHDVVDTLAGFGTRHTLSSTDSEHRGIGAARRYRSPASFADASPR
jgi:hypothetical protein